jgi:hypothetical protein
MPRSGETGSHIGQFCLDICGWLTDKSFALAVRRYRNPVGLRRLSEPAKAGFVFVGAASSRRQVLSVNQHLRSVSPKKHGCQSNIRPNLQIIGDTSYEQICRDFKVPKRTVGIFAKAT